MGIVPALRDVLHDSKRGLELDGEPEDGVERACSGVGMLVAVSQLRPGASCDDHWSGALEVAEQGTLQVWCCHVATEDIVFIETEDIADSRRPLHAGAGKESSGLEALAHEGRSCAELDEGVRPLETRLVWSPVGVRRPLELGRVGAWCHLPFRQEDHGSD